MNIFGKRLKYLRESRGMLGKELAIDLGVDPGTITNWEKGNRFPKDEYLIKICTYFDVTLDYLLGRDISTGDYTPMPIQTLQLKSKEKASTSKIEVIKVTTEIEAMINYIDTAAVVELDGLIANESDIHFLIIAYEKLLSDIKIYTKLRQISELNDKKRV